MKKKTLTDEIYDELVDGLKTGLDWAHFLAKYSASKGPLYNAIGQFFRDMEQKVRASKEVQEKLDQAGLKLDQAGLKLDSLKQTIKEVEGNLMQLEEKRDVLNEQNKTLEVKLEQKSELVQQVVEMEKLGFDIEKLTELKGAVTQIGAKHGLKGKEAIAKFFDDLKDYDVVLEAGVLLAGLNTQIETRKMEAEKWHAETEKIERQYKEFKEVTDAMGALLRCGVKAEQVISWNNSLDSIGGVEELEKGLGRYGSIQKLLAAKKREGKHLDTTLAKLRGQVDVLKEEKSEVEGAIKTLRASGIAEIGKLKVEAEGSMKALRTSVLDDIKEVSQTGVEKIAEVAHAGGDSLQQVGETAEGELKRCLSLVDELLARAVEAGKMVAQVEEKLDKSKEVTEKTRALVSSIEAGK